jgi:ubiquinone/menaquinone biosynthesis C-methylase UbiE
MFYGLFKKFYPIWKSTYATNIKKRRLDFVSEQTTQGHLFDPNWLKGKKILEVGCNQGKDFLQFFDGIEGVELYGVDINEQDIKQKNCTFMQLNADKLPFDDDYFDLVVSFGVLEHVQPMETLCKVISEIDRVCKSYGVIVPNIITLLEPHTAEFFWPLRSIPNKKSFRDLNYFSDDVWTKFTGFKDASIKRYNYLFPLIKNTLIYKPLDNNE